MVDIKQLKNYKEFNDISTELAKDNYCFFKEKNSFGIYYKEKLIGLIELDSFFGTLSINVALVKEYRGKGLAVKAMDKFLEIYGCIYKNAEKFLCVTNPNNISANRSLEKSDWISTDDYDETMLYEGGAFYNVYYKNNPHYFGKRLIKNDKE